jgi:hypothetical protein
MSKIDLSYVTITFESPIVFYQYKDGAELGFPQMKELIQNAEKLSWSRPYFTFSDVRVSMSVTAEGRRYLSDFSHMPYFRGAAVLVKSSMLSVALNFFSHFVKKRYPFKAFVTKEKALGWLKTLPLEEGSEGYVM